MTVALPLEQLAAPGRVVVLVGAAGSGKTTLRTCLLEAGLDAERVVSLDDLRARARARDELAGRPVRPLQDYSLTAVRAAEAMQASLLARGEGYVADATHLRRRERVAHVRGAAAAHLPAAAVLLPALPVDVLLDRVRRRRVERHVDDDVLARQAHRRTLLGPDVLLTEGFAAVYPVRDVYPECPV